MAENFKPTSVGVGQSKTNYGGSNAGGKAKGVHSVKRPAKVASGAAGGKRNSGMNSY